MEPFCVARTLCHTQALFGALRAADAQSLLQAAGLAQGSGLQDMSEACAALVLARTQMCLRQVLQVRGLAHAHCWQTRQ
jgi:hypothetical protein